MPVRVDAFILDLVGRASTREASRVHQQLSRGIFTLDIIAKTAALLGLVCTNFALLVFLSRGITGDRRTWAHMIAPILGEAVIPTALGIAVALLAAWIHKFLTSRVEQFDLEMHAASLDLANSLSRLRFLTN
jgi:biopolymer transport protein ExbB/TolQ